MRSSSIFLCVLLVGLARHACGAADYVGSPGLAAEVASGALPSIEQRLPENPVRVTLDAHGLSSGRHGGELRLLMGREKDVRLMVVYGYARLVGYSQDYELVPDLLEDFEVEEGRRFTLRLRKGLRWSDGEPVTTEDFRYYWEDIASDEDLAPFGPPAALMVGQERPKFEVLDEQTVRFAWSKPNPFFLPALAGARPETIIAPAHYLKQFHAAYADVDQLNALAEEEGRRNWASVHIARFRPYKNINPELPTLQPWVNTTRPPSQRYVFVRNRYYHRVDENGLQLPYIDRVVIDIADGKLIPTKAGAGETDLQARHIAFSDYTFLKQNEQRSRYRVLLWDTTKGAHMALLPNLNVEDPVWRGLVRDVRFRHALSLAIDRSEINQVIYYGLASEGNDTVFRSCPLYKPGYQSRWAEFDLERANQLLDELGLDRRDGDGVRLLPDDRPMEVIVETAGEDTEQTDVLQLIEANWAKVGIKMFAKPLQREVFRNRVFAGQTLMSVWGGLENGLPTADMSPHELAPTEQHQLQWPKWGQFFESGGQAGEAIGIPQAEELMRLYQEWIVAADRRRREEIWHQMLEIRAEQTFTIGLISGVPQPVVVSRKLRNVPDKGVYNWDPGAHFGVYRPDTFWLEEQ